MVEIVQQYRVKATPMLILLCLVFPPAIPFVIVYYLWSGTRRQKKQLKLARQQNKLALELLVATAPQAYIEQRVARARKASRTKEWVFIALVLVVIILALGATQ